MNEIAIAEFVRETEEFIRTHRASLDHHELNCVNELYEDLTAELDRQQLFDELYR